MALFAIILCIITFGYVHANKYPCNPDNYTTISDIRRRTDYKVTSKFMCDFGLIKDDHWYRFQSTAGNKMPTKNPGNGHCGTYIPLWLSIPNNMHPTQENEIKNAKACGAAPFIPPPGCGISYDIKVVKCPGNFYLYRLKEPKQCSLAYCAGESLPQNVPCSYTGDSLPICSGVIPIVKVTAGVKEESSIDVRLRCFWESPGNLTYVQYEARWFNDEKDLKPKIQSSLISGADEKEFLFQPARWNNVNNKTVGYEFQKSVFCQVRARYKSGNWSRWQSSNRIFTGISVHPTVIPIMNDCGEQNREVVVTLRPHLPIRKVPIRIDVFSPRTSLIDEICLVGGKKEFTSCGIIFQKNHPVGSPLRFKLLTSCGTGETNEEFDASYLLKNNNDPPHNSFWFFHKFPEIKLTRTKFRIQECISWGDPHFKTFDGNKYDFMGRGTFLLYRNNFSGTEIQVRQRTCWTRPSCNCGVAIKENVFFRIYDLCSQSGGKWWDENVQTRVYTRFSKDLKLSRFYTKVTPRGSNTISEVHLPSGVTVIAKRYSWGFDIHVKAPVYPDHPSEGLCGNNNLNPNDYFRNTSKWKTPEEFGEHWRIRTKKTAFDFESRDYEGGEIGRNCGKEICVCNQNGRVCGPDAEDKVCFKSLTTSASKEHQDAFGLSCDARKRKKRTLIPDDDSIDDQDKIPPFNPPEVNISSSFTWPTPNGLKEADVRQFCENKLQNSKAGKACKTVEGVDISGLIKDCIFDIQATDDLSWGSESFSAMETSCTVAIYNNASSYKNTTGGSIELNTDVLLSLCPNDCSNHGNCSNATCICDEDYTAADCSIFLKGSPILFDIRKNGLCDRRRRPCRNVGIFGFPLLDSENLTCHIQEYKVIDSLWKPKISVSLYPGLLMDLTEVKCFLPESPVNIGDYDNEGVTAAGLAIAISNNRINASKESMLFITYDSVCQECNATTGCKLKTDACFISGHCFAKNDSNPHDWCQQCFPEFSTTSWLERKDNKPPKFKISSLFYAFNAMEIRVQLEAIDPENRTIQYSLVQNETFGASLSKKGLFSWIKVRNDSTTFMFKATDECGAYTVKNVAVVLKECPCKNSGQCIPDSRDLDGAGNFTCSCPVEYMGALCQDDVNECNKSKQCSNGDCHNEQPGFSCSCFPGYTGDRCEIEIDECKPNPCFFGVNCTDMIASYHCGPCPTEYSGNGKNCTRTDKASIDACVENPKICDDNANCVYNNGPYVCQCTDGYTGDGIYNCTDINECKKLPSVCHSLAKCSNVKGSFVCKCERGYNGDGVVNCTDTDECTQLPPVCHINAHCTNTIGSYSCECFQGYFGDGKMNCTKNESPQFMTPDIVYAIIHKYFEIQIQAEDPEDDDIFYMLVSNGTLTTAEITEKGLLTISEVKKNGTVYIEAKDRRGAKNYMILQVKAIQCPCKNNGTCYQKQGIPYTVLPSDYYCKCNDPYTGHYCEARLNPCQEQPCYPGLRCSIAQNSEGFACEECPPLFDGNGKYCELNSSKGKNSVQSKLVLKDEKWDDQLTVKTSKVFRDLVSRLTVEIRKIYIRIPQFSYFIVKRFRKGSVVADFELLFSSKVNNPFEPLLNAAKTGKLGNMTFEIKMNSDADAGDDDKRDRNIIIIVAVLVVVIIVVVTVFVCFIIKRWRVSKNEKLQRRAYPKGTKPKGISFQRKASPTEREEMDLKVFDNEAVCLD